MRKPTIIAIALSLAMSAQSAVDVVLGRASDLTWAAGVDNNRVASWGSVSYVMATGGTVTNYTENGTNFTAHIFTESGDFVVSAGGTVEVLIVAGGGAGSGYTINHGGGGGGGGLFWTNNYSVGVGIINIAVGMGGVGGELGVASTPGGNSSFDTFVTTGGGYGAGYDGLGERPASSGGSGGGGAYEMAPGEGILGEGYSGGGGSVEPNYGAGGGGGAGGSGAAGSGTTGGNGGPGLQFSLAGISRYYGCGGGGGIYETGTDGVSGTGGNGGSGTHADGVRNNAVNGTGSGGGGSSATSTPLGGNGGSGVVIIRYRRN